MDFCKLCLSWPNSAMEIFMHEIVVLNMKNTIVLTYKDHANRVANEKQLRTVEVKLLPQTPLATITYQQEGNPHINGEVQHENTLQFCCKRSNDLTAVTH